MAAQPIAFKPIIPRRAFVRAFKAQRDELIGWLTPRECIVHSFGAVVAGIGLPFLMVMGFAPATLFLCLLGFALFSTGAVLLLVYAGEL